MLNLGYFSVKFSCKSADVKIFHFLESTNGIMFHSYCILVRCCNTHFRVSFFMRAMWQKVELHCCTTALLHYCTLRLVSVAKNMPFSKLKGNRNLKRRNRESTCDTDICKFTTGNIRTVRNALLP